MLTSFRNVKNVEKVKEQKKEQEQVHNERVKLLFEAIDQIEGNENRVYIEERPYRAELKLVSQLEFQFSSLLIGSGVPFPLPTFEIKISIVSFDRDKILL